ncbi:MAG: ABC transporter substrate-binding protein [Deltaproteobacteria bacterium]|nr:ABC transporter substrate-binding protein [Deltaproteobacteria bacterium]MBW2339176.1 ABC transporter substrate-binding protein [Deltaproteobacteria bacterium]
MKKRNLIFMVACVALLSLTLIPVAGAVRGVTDTEIRIGQWGPQTGPAALWGAVARGSGLYFQMINEEGGIHGRKIKYFLRDDAYQPPKTKSIAKELVEDKKVFAMACGVGTATGMAVKNYLEKNKVPWVGPAAGSVHWCYPPEKAPYLFGTYPLYCDEAFLLVNYAIDKLGKKRIAFFYQNDDYGKVGLIGAQIALERRGMKFAATVSAEPLDTDLSSHCMKLKAAKADVVIMWVLPKHGAIMLGTAAKLGFQPVWMTSSTLSDYQLMYKITKGLFKNVIFTTFGELLDSTNPLMVKYHEAQKRLAPKERWGIFYYAGILFIEPMVEAFRRCGRDLTVDNFIKAMESIKDFQGIGPRMSFGPKKRQGSRSFFMARSTEGGNAKELTGWETSDIDAYEVKRRLEK